MTHAKRRWFSQKRSQKEERCLMRRTLVLSVRGKRSSLGGDCRTWLSASSSMIDDTLSLISGWNLGDDILLLFYLLHFLTSFLTPFRVRPIPNQFDFKFPARSDFENCSYFNICFNYFFKWSRSLKIHLKIVIIWNDFSSIKKIQKSRQKWIKKNSNNWNFFFSFKFNYFWFICFKWLGKDLIYANKSIAVADGDVFRLITDQ